MTHMNVVVDNELFEKFKQLKISLKISTNDEMVEYLISYYDNSIKQNKKTIE